MDLISGNNFSQMMLIMLRMERKTCRELQTVSSPSTSVLASPVLCYVHYILLGYLWSTVPWAVCAWWCALALVSWRVSGSADCGGGHLMDCPNTALHSGAHHSHLHTAAAAAAGTGFGRGVATDTLGKPHNHTNIVIARAHFMILKHFDLFLVYHIMNTFLNCIW